MLSPQRAGGNRVYAARDLARLKLILRGKRLGFSLADIRELLDLYDADRNHLEQLHQTLRKGGPALPNWNSRRPSLSRLCTSCASWKRLYST
ncbi:MAG: MerR family DNA-binding protein [Aliidongia sp.]